MSKLKHCTLTPIMVFTQGFSLTLARYAAELTKHERLKSASSSLFLMDLACSSVRKKLCALLTLIKLISNQELCQLLDII